MHSKETCFLLYRDMNLGGVQRKIIDVVSELTHNPAYNNLNLHVILDIHPKTEPGKDVFTKNLIHLTTNVHYNPQFRWHRFRFPFPLFVLGLYLRYKPKRIISFMSRFSIIALGIKLLFWWRKISVVVSYDNIPTRLMRFYYPDPAKYWLVFYLTKALYPYADRVIVPNQESKQEFIALFGLKPKCLEVNRNWVLESPRVDRPKSIDLVYIGRLDREKNVSEFVELLHLVVNQLPTIQAQIIGVGEELQQICNLIHIYHLEKNVTLKGLQTKVFPYLHQSKLFVLTSHLEGLPIAALEAMSCGVPVISRNHPSAKEFIKPWKNGYIYTNLNDAAMVIQNIVQSRKLLGDMSEFARSYVKAKHGRQQFNQFMQALFTP